jgi:hypothetical protein
VHLQGVSYFAEPLPRELSTRFEGHHIDRETVSLPRQYPVIGKARVNRKTLTIPGRTPIKWVQPLEYPKLVVLSSAADCNPVVVERLSSDVAATIATVAIITVVIIARVIVNLKR